MNMHMNKFQKNNSFSDKVGMTISCACILHCLMVPMIVSILPAVAQPFEELEWLHAGFAAAALLVAIASFPKGYKIHRSKIPIILSPPGISLLWLSLYVGEPHWLEATLVTFGATMMAAAHFLNHRLSKASLPSE